MAEEPTLRDLYLLMQDMNSSLNLKIDQVHGIVRQVQREVEVSRGRLEVLIDSYAALRTEYLREHPHHDAA
jgi:hypothetical protein